MNTYTYMAVEKVKINADEVVIRHRLIPQVEKPVFDKKQVFPL